MTGHAETNLVFFDTLLFEPAQRPNDHPPREAPDQRKSIPIEDIGFVVLEDQQTSITLPLLNGCRTTTWHYPVRREPNAERHVDEFGFKQNAR